MTAAAGFFLASKGDVDYLLIVEMLLGLSLVIASACVINNLIDRDIDKLMPRTKKRALASGLVTTKNAVFYAAILGGLGSLILLVYTNWLTITIGLVGFVDYLVLYSIGKRRSPVGTLIGSISGAAPITAGYCAASGHFYSGAFILFAILVLWQMPHFYAIAIYRLKDYKAAGIPVLPISNGIYATKVRMTIYVISFMAATAALSLLGYTGLSYLIVMMMVGLAWLRLSLRGFRADDNELWARQSFRFSLVVLMIFSLIISIDVVLP